MIKSKAIFAPIFPRIYQNLHKFYKKPVERVKSVNLTEAGAVSSHSSASGLNSIAGSPESVRSGENSKIHGEQFARNIDIRIKKGKKCSQHKPIIPKDPGPPGGEYIKDKCGFYHVPKTNSRKWKKISLVLLSFVVAFSVFVMTRPKEHPEHKFVPYEHMYIRNKRFPWGDGKKSLFHGPNNFIPEEQNMNSEGEEQ